MSATVYEELTDAERNWVQNHLDQVSLFIDAYSPADSGQAITLKSLDRAFASWFGQDVRDNTQINGTINIVGIQFGQFLVDAAGFRWVIATDTQRTDLAILALPGQGDVLVYPANFVAKRWERREADFLARSFDAIRAQVREVAAKNARKLDHPWWRFW
jgi:Domain of unknown function (DUF3806)